MEQEFITQFGYGFSNRMSQAEQRSLASGFLWIDWCSIPQIKVRVNDDHDVLMTASSMSPMARAVNSIPAYTLACDMFMVVCPALIARA